MCRSLRTFERFEIVPSSKKAFDLARRGWIPLTIGGVDADFIGPTARGPLSLETAEKRAERSVLAIDVFSFWQKIETNVVCKVPAKNFARSVEALRRSSNVTPPDGVDGSDVWRHKPWRNGNASSNQLVLFSHLVVFDETKAACQASDLRNMNGERFYCPICDCGVRHPQDSYVVLESGTPDGDPSALAWCPELRHNCMSVEATPWFKGIISPPQALNARKRIRHADAWAFRSTPDGLDGLRKNDTFEMAANR